MCIRDSTYTPHALVLLALIQVKNGDADISLSHAHRAKIRELEIWNRELTLKHPDSKFQIPFFFYK
jgi:hypothetical protein